MILYKIVWDGYGPRTSHWDAKTSQYVSYFEKMESVKRSLAQNKKHIKGTVYISSVTWQETNAPS